MHQGLVPLYYITPIPTTVIVASVAHKANSENLGISRKTSLVEPCSSNFRRNLLVIPMGGCSFNIGDLLSSETTSSKDHPKYGALLGIADNVKLPFYIYGPQWPFREHENVVTFTGAFGEDPETYWLWTICRLQYARCSIQRLKENSI